MKSNVHLKDFDVFFNNGNYVLNRKIVQENLIKIGFIYYDEDNKPIKDTSTNQSFSYLYKNIKRKFNWVINIGFSDIILISDMGTFRYNYNCNDVSSFEDAIKDMSIKLNTIDPPKIIFSLSEDDQNNFDSLLNFLDGKNAVLNNRTVQQKLIEIGFLRYYFEKLFNFDECFHKTIKRRNCWDIFIEFSNIVLKSDIGVFNYSFAYYSLNEFEKAFNDVANIINGNDPPQLNILITN